MGTAPFNDAVQGKSVLVFDEEVLELFTERAGSIGRIHVSQLYFEVKPPNRRGYREATFSPSSSGLAGFSVIVTEAEWPVLQQVVTEIEAARAP